MATTQHTLIALVQDKPGVMNRIASLFQRARIGAGHIEAGTERAVGSGHGTGLLDGSRGLERFP